MRFLILFTTLMAGWLLMSGIYNGLLIGFGIASCLLCTWLSLRIGAIDREGLPTHLFCAVASLFGLADWRDHLIQYCNSQNHSSRNT